MGEGAGAMGFRAKAARAALAAAAVGGASYMAGWPLHALHAVEIAWKGSGVALLAVYAGLRARSADGWLIAAVMALGALGDVLLEAIGLTRGALAFVAGHLVAVVLYLRNRRPELTPGDGVAAALLAPAIVAAAFLSPSDRGMAPGIALYAAGLGAMTASAWISRFPRSLTGLGALMFAASDLLIFARAGPLAGAPWVGYAVWTLYFAGQAMICVGVVRTLDAPASARPPAAGGDGSGRGRGAADKVRLGSISSVGSAPANGP
jgi:uncharacterized membrane protein YhhN